MNRDIFSLISESKKINKYPGIKYILEIALHEQNFLTFFVSPEIILKTTIIKEFKETYTEFLTAKERAVITLLSLDLTPEEMLLNAQKGFEEDNLIYTFMFFAKKETITEELLASLLQKLNSTSNFTKEYYYINILLGHYYLQYRDFTFLEKHLKNCLDYIKNDTTVTEYEIMITYLLCAKYLENKTHIFLDSAKNYYKQAETICVKFKDNITLAHILIATCSYFNSIDNRKMSLYYAQKSIYVSKPLSFDALNYRLYYTLGLVSLNIGNYGKASKYINKAVNIAYNLEDFPYIQTAKLLNTLGSVYLMDNDTEKAVKCHLDALIELSSSDSIYSILEEAIKTFHYLFDCFLILGDISKALYFLELSASLINNADHRNRIIGLFDISRIYSDLGLLYAIYKDDSEKAESYYNLAVTNIREQNIYSKKCILLFLECYLAFKNNEIDKFEIYEKSLTYLEKYDSYNVFLQQLKLTFYVYFFKVIKDANLLEKAQGIAENFNLPTQLKVYKDLILEEKVFPIHNINLNQYPINLILTLSKEWSKALDNERKAKYYDLLQGFSNKISSVYDEKQLYLEADTTFEKYFLSKGFISLKYSVLTGFSTEALLNTACDFTKTQLINEVEGFLLQNNIPFNISGKNFSVYNQKTSGELVFIKSLLLYSMNDEINNDSYFFIIFNDYKSDWIFTDEDGLTAMSLIEAIFLKLKNIHFIETIKNTTLLDPLTSLFNAKYLWSRLDIYFQQYLTTGITFSMALIDLNNFKTLNDTYGHTAGDELLKLFAKILKIALAPNEEIIRYGGDEFVLLFPGIYKTEAEKYMQSVKSLCSKHFITVTDATLEISFAYGLETFSDEFENKKIFFDKVDSLMYINKQAMKNLLRI